MLDAALDGSFRAIYIQGEDILQSDPNTHHVAAGLAAMDLVIVHDLFLNETANYAHVFLPGSTFLEKTGPRFPLLLTTGRVLSQYNVGAQTRRTQNNVWHEQDLLEVHPADAENRGLKDGDWATNCPEYKVTAVQVLPSNGPTDWQESYASWSEKSRRIAAGAAE